VSLRALKHDRSQLFFPAKTINSGIRKARHGHCCEIQGIVPIEDKSSAKESTDTNR
jgi:hypothetical protein